MGGFTVGVLWSLGKELGMFDYLKESVSPLQFSAMVITSLIITILHLYGVSFYSMFVQANLFGLWFMGYIYLKYCKKMKRVICMLHTLDQLEACNPNTIGNQLLEKVEKFDELVMNTQLD
jgi:hypothetical protein